MKNKDFALVCASNDGTEIEALKSIGFSKVIGVEPAKNLADMANEKGLETINAFFGKEMGRKIAEKYGNADLVVANNVFAHIPDPVDFLAGMKEVAGDRGRISIEVHWLLPFVKEVQIETLYGEHYYVWSVTAMRKIADICGLVLFDVEVLEKQHGGSIRSTFVAKGEERDSVRSLLNMESEAGILKLESMKSLQVKANRRKERFVGVIKKLKKDGKRIAIWTVPAKIATLLNFSSHVQSYPQIF